MTQPTQAQIEAAAKAIQKSWRDDEIDSTKTAKAALTAVGWPLQELVTDLVAIEEAVADERERCAQVADSFRYGGYEQIADAIAAAIRNLRR